MELDCGGFNQHIIYVYLHSYAYLLLEHPVYQSLVSGSCVLESKRHHPIAIGSLRCDEQGLFLVVWVHTDLVVAREGIHKTEKFIACCSVHDEVDPWQREAVLWAGFVYVGEVDTESPFAVRFLDEHDVSQPLRILYLPDRFCLEEFADLLDDSLLPFWCEAPSLLLDRFAGRAGVQPMCDYCRVNSSHVRLLPCEDVSVLSQKLSEEAFEFSR